MNCRHARLRQRIQAVDDQHPGREVSPRIPQTRDYHHDQGRPFYPKGLEANIPEALTVFAFREAHQRRLRTNHGLERLNNEIKRRTGVAALFPNDASLLRLVSAILSEISDDWETPADLSEHESQMTRL